MSDPTAEEAARPVKKLMVLTAAAAAAGYAIYQRMQANKAEQELWAEATDPVPPRDVR